MFFATNFDPLRLYPRRDEGMMEYMASFSPLAPMVGVRWRFADMFETGGKPVKTRAKPSPIKTDAEDAVVVPVAARKPAPEPTPEPVPAPAAEAAEPEALKAAARLQEKAKAAAKPKGEPKAEPDPKAEDEAKVEAAPAPAPKPEVNDLTAIKGVGPKAAETLAGLGVTSYAQIAAWTDRQVDEMEAAMGGIPGRIKRDDWVGQAKKLVG